MQFKVFTTLALAAAAIASPTSGLQARTEECTTEVQCCESTQIANTIPGIGLILALLGIVVPDLNVLAGLNCIPISLLGGGACDGDTVCCNNNHVSGLISIGCVPVIIDL